MKHSRSSRCELLPVLLIAFVLTTLFSIQLYQLTGLAVSQTAPVSVNIISPVQPPQPQPSGAAAAGPAITTFIPPVTCFPISKRFMIVIPGKTNAMDLGCRQAVTRVEFTSSESATNAVLWVDLIGLKNLSIRQGLIAYQANSFKLTNLSPESITSASLIFRIPLEWFAANNVSWDEFRSYNLPDLSAMPTAVQFSDDSYAYYKSFISFPGTYLLAAEKMPAPLVQMPVLMPTRIIAKPAEVKEIRIIFYLLLVFDALILIVLSYLLMKRIKSVKILLRR